MAQRLRLRHEHGHRRLPGCKLRVERQQAVAEPGSELNLGTEQPFHIPDLFPMRISTSDVGCWRWVGSASTTKTYDDGAGLRGGITGDAVVRWDVSALLAGSLYFEPRAGLIDGSGSGRLGACTFTEVAERAMLDATAPPTGQPYGRLHMNLDLDLGFGDPPNRALTALKASTSPPSRPHARRSGRGSGSGPSVNRRGPRPADSSPPRAQNRLAATLMVKARMAVLKTKDSTDCNSTQRRSVRVLTFTSAVCEATAMVKAK